MLEAEAADVPAAPALMPIFPQAGHRRCLLLPLPRLEVTGGSRQQLVLAVLPPPKLKKPEAAAAQVGLALRRCLGLRCRYCRCLGQSPMLPMLKMFRCRCCRYPMPGWPGQRLRFAAGAVGQRHNPPVLHRG